ncbi:MAG: DUF3419 family protein [Candidatus Acidiferrales bacterium]
MTGETPWRAGRLGSANGAHRLLFGRMYEDAEIEREAFRGRGRVFCIASAGCTAIHLSDEHEVVACDINPVQLAYAERRIQGAAPEVGDAERAMSFARTFMPLVGWRAGVVHDFLALSNVGEQIEFWHKHLDTRRFRTSFDAMMSRGFLRVGYAPHFLSFLPTKFGAVLRRRLERGISKHPNATNPYVRALFLGQTNDAPQPNILRIQFVLGDAASYLESCREGCFDAVTLSNILDGADSFYRDRLLRAVQHAATEDAAVVLRSFGEPTREHANNFAENDRAMLWGVVEVRGANSL